MQQQLKDKQDNVMEGQLILQNTQNMLDSDFYNPSICEGCDTVITDLYIMKVCIHVDRDGISFRKSLK